MHVVWSSRSVHSVITVECVTVTVVLHCMYSYSFELFVGQSIL